MAILEQPPVPGRRSGIIEQIRAALPDLPPAERRIGERILADPGQAIALSISEFAAACNVAQPTVSKFCRSVGASSYAALRLGLSNDFAVRPNMGSPETDSASAIVTSIATLISTFRSTAALPVIAHALLNASHIDIWSIPEFAPAGALLADRLMEMAFQAANATVPARWAARTAGIEPGAIVILLTAAIDEEMLGALVRARQAGARILCCTIQTTRRIVQAVDWLIPLPASPSIELSGFALTEAIITAVQAAADIPGPAGPASPWRMWVYTRPVFLPTPGDPIPAMLLLREDPPKPRPLIFFFSGLGFSKENALLGMPNNLNGVGPRFVAALLNSGYHVLTIDAQAHGDRKRRWQETEVLLEESLSGRGDDVLTGARADARFLVDGVRELDMLHTDTPIAVVGSSWGGLQTLLTFSGDPRISCAVSIMPVIHIPSIPRFRHLEGQARVEAGSPGAWMAPALAPRPLCLIAGEKDEIAPARSAQAFVEAVRPHYETSGADQHLECIVLPDVGHGYNERMVDCTLEWLGRYLPKPTRE